MTRQEKRNKVLAVSLFVFVVLAVAYYWHGYRDHSPLDGRMFSVPDLTVIDKVVLENETGTVDISFDGVRWRANDHTADRELIEVLFATLQQVRPVRPVARAWQDSIRTHLQGYGTKVSLYEGSNLALCFFAGGNARKTQAYFRKQGDDQVYIAGIPGYRVYAAGIFEVGALGWKDKHVFQLNWRNFSELKARFPNRPDADFDVRFLKDYFSIAGMDNTDTTRLNDFLDAVSLLTVLSYSDDSTVLNGLREKLPDMVIRVSDVTGKEYSLALYNNGAGTASATGIIDDSMLAYFNRKELEGILRNRDFFRSASR